MKNTITPLTRPSRTNGFVCTLTGIALLTTTGSPAFAGQGNVGNSNIMPPQSVPYGQTYPEWAESFWQWAQAFPSNANPANGSAPPESAQSGPVWFLASAPFSPVTGFRTLRDITVPSGTSLFSPVSSFFNDNEGVDPPLSEEELLADANDIWDALAIRTECIIDGKPVKGLEDPQHTAYRLQTGLFDVEFADGTTTDEVAVGAFVMIKPLPTGQHTVRLIGAIEPAPGFVLTKDVTYTVTVKP